MFKKSMSVLLLVCTLLISMSTILPVLAAVRGDIDGSGSVTRSDYLLVKRHVLGTHALSGSELSNADVDGDGDVDKTDYTIVKRIALGTLESSTAVQPRKVVSYGKTYTKSVSESSNYEDAYDSELTDGNISASPSYSNEAYCGFQSSVNVDIDLGTADGKNLRVFELSYLSYSGAGITPPASFTVYGSNNKYSWTNLGSKTLPEYVSDATMTASIELETPVNYRYIRFNVVKGNSAWLFFDEVLVYADVTDDDYSESDSAYTLDTLTDSERASQLASVSSGKSFDPELGETLVSKGRSYTVTCSGYDSRNGQNSSLLTDGTATGLAFDNPVWVGINAASQSSVTINLGSKYTDLCTFSLHCFNRTSASITLPEYVDVSVSSNNSTYYTVGRAYAVDNHQENFAYVISLNDLITAQYVRFTFPATDGYVWVEEAAVYANRYNVSERVYGIFNMPLSEIPEYWSSSSADYNTKQNLLLGKYPEIISDSPMTLNGNYATYNTAETSPLLTDGKTADAIDTTVDPWFGFYKGTGRSVFFDLGKISSVSDFSVRLLYRYTWGIGLPDYIDVLLSENGKDWYTAASVSPKYETDDSIILASGSFDKAYRARYVMFKFPVLNHVYMDEITVSGTKNAKSASLLSDSGLDKCESVFNYGYSAPSDDVLSGAEDVCLLYHNGGNYNYATLFPFVAYVDENGNVVDTMFDSFLFLPSTSPLPSGGRPYGTNYASDWEYLMDDMFISWKNFGALENAVGDTKDLLNIPDYKVKVFVTIPHMDTTLSDFGDIDGDGDSEDLTSLDSRVYVARCYAEKIIEKFASMDYENIELCGFYWFHEEIQGDDVTTAQYVNKAFDDLGMPLFWIPWFKAPGYSSWKSLGFDATCLQPNYAFDIEKLETRLKDAASLAQQYGMSIEMEISWDAPTDIRYFQKYMDYLSGGLKYGYINECIHMYYQSFNVIPDQYDSESDRLRLIYKYTYLFMKGALDITPETVSPRSCTVKVNTPKSFTLNPDKDETTIYRISKTPSHGSVALAENGTFVYYPNKDFKGTDTFTYQISNYLGWSQDCTVTVTVE